ncbi:uncharacterized protein areg [Synchiropus picturatus]
MNAFIFSSLLCFAVSGVFSAQGSKTNSTSELSVGTGVWGSAGGLQTHPRDDHELGGDDELSGGSSINTFDFHGSKDDKKRRKGKGKKKNKHKIRTTTALRPARTISTHVSTLMTTEDPCTSTHLGYCIHGYCQRIEGLQEPVCICMKGYDGERCGIQTLEVNKPAEEGKDSELLQSVLVVIAVVLSVLSCIAILLMACTHYRSHKHFLASYLGTAAEQEKLQKPLANLAV